MLVCVKICIRTNKLNVPVRFHGCAFIWFEALLKIFHTIISCLRDQHVLLTNSSVANIVLTLWPAIGSYNAWKCPSFDDQLCGLYFVLKKTKLYWFPIQVFEGRKPIWKWQLWYFCPRNREPPYINYGITHPSIKLIAEINHGIHIKCGQWLIFPSLNFNGGVANEWMNA